MRRKLGPHPIETRTGAARPLNPLIASVARTALPTAAALAMALAGIACSGVEQESAISADKVPTTHVQSAASTEPSASPSASASIEPVPMALPGEMMIVSPPPPVPSTVPTTGAVAPATSAHKTAGKPMTVHPTI